MNLKRVKKDEHLHWPHSVSGSDTSYRGGPGYVLDLDAPCERDLFLKGQEHKLEPAPAGSKLTPITHAIALNAIKAARAKSAAPTAPAAAPIAKLGGELPLVDPIPKRHGATR
jgi:hypothetical protein